MLAKKEKLILKALKEQPNKHFNLNRIAATIGLRPEITHNILDNLTSLGYITKGEELFYDQYTKQYRTYWVYNKNNYCEEIKTMLISATIIFGVSFAIGFALGSLLLYLGK